MSRQSKRGLAERKFLIETGRDLAGVPLDQRGPLTFEQEQSFIAIAQAAFTAR